MKTITVLDHTESTNWPLDDDVMFPIYGWFKSETDSEFVPDFVNATRNYVKETYQTEYQLKKFEDIDKTKPWFIFLYSYFQYRLNYDDKDTLGKKQLFQGIPEHVINELVHGNARLIISCENEAHTINYFNVFYALYNNNPIVPANRIIYLTAAHNIHDMYKNYCLERSIPQDQQFETWYSHHGWLPWIKKYINIYTLHLPAGKKEKKFINLNRVPRAHRILFLSLLAEYDLLKHGYVSFGLPDTGFPSKENLLHYVKDHSEFWYSWDRNSQPHIDAVSGSKKLLESLPLRVDTDDLEFNWVGYDAHPIAFMKQSYFSIVSGTNAFKRDEQGVTVNEKEFKAILCKHPFLLVARPNTLAQLREIGFRTFGQWIDESYDTEEDDAVRLFKIANEVQRLCDISNSDWDRLLEEMSEVLEHNFNWLVNHTEKMCFNFTDLKNLLKYAV